MSAGPIFDRPLTCKSFFSGPLNPGNERKLLNELAGGPSMYSRVMKLKKRPFLSSASVLHLDSLLFGFDVDVNVDVD